MKTNAGRLLAVVVALAAINCDPGVRYVPQGWSNVGAYQWAYQNEDFRAVMHAPGNLIGMKSLVPEPDVHSRTSEPIVFESAKILTRSAGYNGTFGGGDRVDVRTVPAGQTKRIPIYFEFDKPIADALGAEFTLVMRYRVGTSAAKEVSTAFSRSK